MRGVRVRRGVRGEGVRVQGEGGEGARVRWVVRVRV